MNKFGFDDLKNKIAVVTGGSSGIGLAITEALAISGATVVIINRNADTAAAVISRFPEEVRSKVTSVPASVLDETSLVSAADHIRSAFGHVGLLVNCAGGNSPKATTPAETISADFPSHRQDSIFGVSIDELKKVFDLNLFGTLLPTMIFGEEMVKRKEGSIVNISSVASFHPLTKVPAYSASKASINSLTQWLAVHFAPSNVRVNAIAPGFFLTEQNRFLLTDEKTGKLSPRGEKIIASTPMGRFGETNDLQGAALYLLSDLSKFVTGTILSVDGGFTAYSGV